MATNKISPVPDLEAVRSVSALRRFSNDKSLKEKSQDSRSEVSALEALDLGDRKSIVNNASNVGSVLSRLSQNEEIMKTLGMSAARDRLEIIVQVIVMAIPLLTVVVLAALNMQQSQANMNSARMTTEALQRSERLAQLVDKLQVERGISCMHIGTVGRENANASTYSLVYLRRNETEKVYSTLISSDWLQRSKCFGTLCQSIGSLPVSNGTELSMETWYLNAIKLIRKQVDEVLAHVQVFCRAYHDIVLAIIRLMTESMSVNDQAQIIRMLNAYSAWTLGIEYTGMLRGFGAGFHASGAVTVQNLCTFASLRGSADGLTLFAGFNALDLSNYRSRMADSTPDVLERVVRYEKMHKMMNESINPIENPTEFSQAWFRDMTDYIDELNTYDESMLETLTRLLSSVINETSFEFNALLVASILLIIVSLSLAACYAVYARRIRKRIHSTALKLSEKTQKLTNEERKTYLLLCQLMPKSIVHKLRMGMAVHPEAFECASVLFCDIVGFTPLCAQSSPEQVVALLNELYNRYDTVMDTHDCYKVETIGDAVLVVSGAPLCNGNDHSCEIALVALGFMTELGQFEIPHIKGERLLMRIGLHTGPITAGVVGHRAPRYCMFGDTVNTASRMETMLIHISGAFYEHLTNHHRGFVTELRGQIPIKGKGMMTTYWLHSRQGHPTVLSVENSEHRLTVARYMKMNIATGEEFQQQ